jgi:hypothetical protein
MRTLLSLFLAAGLSDAGLSFHYTHSSSHSHLTLSLQLGGYGTTLVAAPARHYGGVVHGRWPTPHNRFYATTDNVWFFNPYDPPSYRTFGLVRLDSDGQVTGVSHYPRSGRGFDFDLTLLQNEAALRADGLGVKAAQEEKARSRAIQAGLAALRSRRTDAAQQALKEAVWVDPDDGPAQVLFGTALLAGGDLRNADKAIRRGLAAMPEFKREWARLADLIPAREDRDRIGADLKARCEADPADAPARFLAGWVAFSSGDAAGAAELWGKLAEDPFRARLLELAR